MSASLENSARSANSAGPSPRPTKSSLINPFATFGVVTAVSLLLGGLTSFGQTLLPDPLRPFANSASSWALLTAAIVATARVRTAPSAVLGAVSFVALLAGYAVVSDLRGFPDSEGFFLVISVIAGPAVGAAASTLHRFGISAAIGAALLAGIATGEAAYGLIVISVTTGWVYWTLVGSVGVVLVAWTCVRRLESFRDRAITVGLTAVVAAVFLLIYSSL